MGFGVGLASGVLGGALNEAGPPVVIYLTLKQWPKDDVKATLQVDSALPRPLRTCYLFTCLRACEPLASSLPYFLTSVLPHFPTSLLPYFLTYRCTSRWSPSPSSR